MNESTPRLYDGSHRTQAAAETRARILDAARRLMGAQGIDAVTIGAIAKAANVAPSTIYAGFKSKDGILRALMEASLFGPAFQQAQSHLSGITDPVLLIAATARVARAIYDGEQSDLGLLRHASGFSPTLRAVEQDFETQRLAMQQARIAALFAAGRARPGLTEAEARRVLWMMTSRAVYQSLVLDGGWTPDRYQDWLAEALLRELVAPVR
jgi:AcrR family transcriptional regulator